MPWYLYIALKQIFPTGKTISFYQNKDPHWSRWLRSAGLLHQGDVSGAQHFMTAFGGMGSISDYYGQLGPNIKEAEKTLDEKISDRLNKAYDWASRLTRTQN